MRWWRGIGSGLIFVGLVQPGCGGRSSNVEDEGESGSAGAGRTGENAGRSSGFGGSQAGRDDVVPGTGGSILLPEGGRAGRGGLAGRGGSPGAGGFVGEVGGAGDGGVSGEPACECSGLCEESVDSFCQTGVTEIGCPLRLDAARELERYCESDAENLVYSECEGVVTIDYTIGGENTYELAFSRETGALTYGYASEYSFECDGLAYRAGNAPAQQNCRSCSFCADFGYAGAPADDPGFTRCELDEAGRVKPPPNNLCECLEQDCVLSASDFCPPDFPFSCPVALEQARQVELLCNAEHQDGGVVYGECPDGIAFLEWGDFDNFTTLGFEIESGELVSGKSLLYATGLCVGASSPGGVIRTGAELDTSTCRSCSLYEYCSGDSDARVDCVVDEQGRVSLPD